MDEQEGWQLEASAPELYQRYLVPAMTAMWAADLADRAALRRGERVIDVACGTGVNGAPIQWHEGSEDVGAALAPYVGSDGLVVPQEVHIVLASFADPTG
jgi:hypothetical protein